MSKESTPSSPPIIPKKFLLPFILTTCCFALWGFANDVTNPLVKVFREVFLISNAKSSWVQAAFYGGYFTMALPAVFFIRKFSYKAAIMIGFSLYAVGALLTIPASLSATFEVFLIGLYILTFGLAFLETACNPYILAMGDPETATQRLNLAQAFNPIGSLVGMSVMAFFIAPNLMVGDFRGSIEEHDSTDSSLEFTYDGPSFLYTKANALPEGAILKEVDGTKVVVLDDELASEVTFYEEGLPNYKTTFGKLDSSVIDGLKAMRATDPAAFDKLQQADLGFVRKPYVIVGCVVIGFLILFAITKMPSFKADKPDAPFGEICSRIFALPRFREGVIAQAFYVGAQITCWTFVIHYGMEIANLTLATATKWNIAAMIIFISSRFICTYLLRFLNPGRLMGSLAVVAIILLMGTIFIPGKFGLACLVLVSACMSLMFPTIYGIALKGMAAEEAKLGSAFLIMAIVGGALLPLAQGKFMDNLGIQQSFWLPVVCFAVVAAYGFRSMLRDRQLTHRPHPTNV